jgi:hypothetical protein
MVAYNGILFHFYIGFFTRPIKNKYSEKDGFRHFEKKVCQWRVVDSGVREERKKKHYRRQLAWANYKKKANRTKIDLF